MLEPRISKRGNKLHLSYELDHRINCSCIYPLPAPNGSTILLYGHDTGMRILWRGGRRPRAPSADSNAPPEINGTSKNGDISMLDDMDTEQHADTTGAQDRYEANDYAQDPDCPYPHIAAELNIEMDTEVLHVAVPSLVQSAGSQAPSLARTYMVVTLACADTRVRVMTISLAPPAPGTEEEYLEDHVTNIELQGSKSIARDLAVKILSSQQESSQDAAQSQSAGREEKLLVASVGSELCLWSLDLSLDSITASPTSLVPQFQKSLVGVSVCYQPSQRSSRIFVAEPSGSAYILDVQAAEERPASSDSTSRPSNLSRDRVKWITSFQTPYHTAENGSAVLARRKKILSAACVLGDRGILLLLEDGQWGIWDVSGNVQSAGKSVQDFALQGYLNTSSTDSTSQQSQKKTIGSKLAPMTPNTRKQKAENLFTGSAKPVNVASSGGIAVTSTTTTAGQHDESVVLWYNNDIYAINSMQTFWQRSTSSGSADRSSFGGLYAPGLTHLTDINLLNENITSISQFAPISAIATSSLGQINTQSNLMVSAEHRYVILQHIRPQIRSREQLQPAMDRPISRDQRMLDAGEADLGGMNRILDGMAGDGRVRRVGFAS